MPFGEREYTANRIARFHCCFWLVFAAAGAGAQNISPDVRNAHEQIDAQFSHNVTIDGVYYAYGEAIAWPKRELLDGETLEQIAETKSILRFFAYEVEDDIPTQDEFDRYILRDSVAQARRRFGLTPGRTVSWDLLYALRAAQDQGKFPCPPGLKTLPTTKVDERNTFEITFTGRQPALYMAQALMRLYHCSPGVFVTEDRADEKPLDEFLIELPVKDKDAAALFGKLQTETQIFLTPEKGQSGVALNARIRIGVPLNNTFSEATYRDDQSIIAARRPTDSQLTNFCREIGHSESCLKRKDVKTVDYFLEKGQIDRYYISLMHFDIKMRITLPGNVASQLIEDMAQQVVWENKKNRERYVKKPERRSLADTAQPLSNHALNESDSGSPSSYEIAKQAAAKRWAVLGWPRKFESKENENSSGKKITEQIFSLDKYHIAIIDSEDAINNTISPNHYYSTPKSIKHPFINTTLAGNAVAKTVNNQATSQETNPNNFSTPNADTTRGASVKQQARADKAKVNPANNVDTNNTVLGWSQHSGTTFPNQKDDPGHTLFAMGLLTGRDKPKMEWSGIAHTDHNIVAGQRSLTDGFVGRITKTFKPFTILREYIDYFPAPAIKPMDSVTNVLQSDITILISEDDWCAKATQAGEWTKKAQDLRKSFGPTHTNRYVIDKVFLISAPYRKKKDGCQTPTSDELKTIDADHGNDWACPSGTHNDQGGASSDLPNGNNRASFPMVCAAMTNSHHIILVASANKDLNDIANNQFRPTNLEERYLAAPGCDLVSADIDPKKNHIYRRRAPCSSSFAAPMAGALISQLKQEWVRLTREIENSKDYAAIDVKAHLIATSDLPKGNPGTSVLYGILNWHRAVATNPEQLSVWFNSDVGWDDPNGDVCKKHGTKVVQCQGRLVINDSWKMTSHPKYSFPWLLGIGSQEDRSALSGHDIFGVRLFKKENETYAYSHFFSKMPPKNRIVETFCPNQDGPPYEKCDFSKIHEIKSNIVLLDRPGNTPGDVCSIGYNSENELPPCVAVCPYVNDKKHKNKKFVDSSACVRINPYEATHMIFPNANAETRLKQFNEYEPQSNVDILIEQNGVLK